MILNLSAIASAALSLGLGVWFLTGTLSNQTLQRGLQKQQDDIQARQLAIQTFQQQLQLQQQRIDAAAQLSNQTGPAIIRDLAELQLANNNRSLARVLQKHGITATADTPAAKTPAPKR